MRDHFNPLQDVGPLLYNDNDDQQQQEQQYNNNNNNENEMTTTTAVMAEASSVSSPTSSAENVSPGTTTTRWKRQISLLYEDNNDCSSSSTMNDNQDTAFDCHALQSSLKRVKLSCSPGELRLQRDLKMLPVEDWVPIQNNNRNRQYNDRASRCSFPLSLVDPTSNATTTSSSWIHRTTQTRLTLIDSLRLCLFLPLQQQQHQYPSQHSSHSPHYQWRIMIQIPRMFPHRPPAISRLEGLSNIEQIVITETLPSPSTTKLQIETEGKEYEGGLDREKPLICHDDDHNDVDNKNIDDESIHTSSSQQQHRQFDPSCTFSSSTFINKDKNQHGKIVIVWNQWSPIANLNDLLEFLINVATVKTPLCNNRMKREESYLLRSTVISSSESTMLARGSNNGTTTTANHFGVHSDVPLSPTISSYFIEEHKSDNDACHVRNSTRSTLSRTSLAASISTSDQKNNDDCNAEQSTITAATTFFSSNRFDIGYEKYTPNSNNGFKQTTITPGKQGMPSGMLMATLNDQSLFNEQSYWGQQDNTATSVSMMDIND